MGGVILRSSATTDYDPVGNSWSYQMWNVPGKPGGFTVFAPSRVHDSASAPWHHFAQVVNDDGQVEMYEDGRYCFTAHPTPGAEELQIKFDIFQLDYALLEVDLTNLRYFIPEGGRVEEEAEQEAEE